MEIDLKKLGIERTYTLDTVKNIPDSVFPMLNFTHKMRNIVLLLHSVYTI